MQHALLDFYNDSNETLKAVTNQLLAKLKSGLDLQKLSVYTANNAGVNYGKQKKC